MESKDRKYRLYSEVQQMPIEWLWKPYIAFGKITIIQGDPGDGKSSMMMNLIGSVTSGRKLPDGTSISPIHVLYQCSEDSISDTIKPRLEIARADCRKVAFINEELSSISLDEEIIRKTIIDFKVKLMVIDPFQAYLGDSDISNVSSIRKLMRRLSTWATSYGCAIVLIGHLNKKQSSKELYRGLGSIDVVAAARSVIHIERSLENNDIRIMRHIKSSIAPKGCDMSFTIDGNKGVIWEKLDEQTESHIITGKADSLDNLNKQGKATELINVLLKNGPVKTTEICDKALAIGISKKTMLLAKKEIGVNSFRKNGHWYWSKEEK